jgi:hypothetical protein
MASKRCLFCRQLFEPYAPMAGRQRVCKSAECRRKLKRLLEAALLRRRPASWSKERNHWLREWAKTYPRYWQHYRRAHPAYVMRDNARRARALRRQRWGCSAKPEL